MRRPCRAALAAATLGLLVPSAAAAQSRDAFGLLQSSLQTLPTQETRRAVYGPAPENLPRERMQAPSIVELAEPGYEPDKARPCFVKYLAVYHIRLGDDDYALKVASSCDLIRWIAPRKLVDHGASMGDVARVGDRGYLVAWEQQTRRGGEIVRNNIRIAHYTDGTALTEGRPSQVVELPRRLSDGSPPAPNSEGTPDFQSITWKGTLEASTIRLGFHYLKKRRTSRGRTYRADSEAVGILRDGRWSARPADAINRTLDRFRFNGSHGARDTFAYGGEVFRLYEARHAHGADEVENFDSWRLFLERVTCRRHVAQLDMRVPFQTTPRTPTRPGGAVAFANPRATVVSAPPGFTASPRVLVVSGFVFDITSDHLKQVIFHVPAP